MSKSTFRILFYNSMLDDIRTALNNHYRYVESRDSFVTAEKVRNAFLGYEVRQQTLLELFKQHNEDASKLNGISKAPATLVKYDRTYRRLEEFMKAKYKVSDIALREIDHKFVTDFEFYLRTVSRCNENTTGKFMQIFRKIVLIAKNNGWITIDPFANYHIHMKAASVGAGTGRVHLLLLHGLVVCGCKEPDQRECRHFI